MTDDLYPHTWERERHWLVTLERLWDPGTIVALERCGIERGCRSILRMTSYFGDYRFSEDLVFTFVEDVTFEMLLEELNPIFAIVQRASGIIFRFLRQDPDAHVNSHTFYVTYEGPLAASAAGRQVKVDITRRERLVYPPIERPVLRGYEEYTDLPEGPTIPARTLDEIGAEKAVAIMDPARSEPRDLYDLWYLSDGAYIELAALQSAVEQKLVFRGRTLPEIRNEFRAKEARYRALWEKRLAMQMAELPEFDKVYRAAQRVLRRAKLIQRAKRR